MAAVASPLGDVCSTMTAEVITDGQSGRVFIARHGERADFADEDWLKQAESPHDPPLTPSGLQQAHELGVRLRDSGLKYIYCSPFLRTAQTAHQVARLINVAVRVEHGLCEGLLDRLFPRGLPTFQSPEQLKESLSLIDPSYKSFYTLDKFPETYADAKARCAHVARGLAGRHPRDNFLMVGHGLSVEYLATALVTDEPCSVHIPYCCLTECIRVPGGSEKWRYGAHMEHSFLSVPQEKTEADRQRELWYETQEV